MKTEANIHWTKLIKQTLHQLSLCLTRRWGNILGGKIWADPTEIKYQNLGQPPNNFHHLWRWQWAEHGAMRIREISLIVWLSPHLSAANRSQVRIKVTPYKTIYIVSYTSACILRTKDWKKNEISSLFFFHQIYKICHVEQISIDSKYLECDTPNKQLEQIISIEMPKDIE